MSSAVRTTIAVFVVCLMFATFISCHGFFQGPMLTSISVTPSTPTLAVGATQQFTASGVNDDGSTSNLDATWTSSDITVATITSGGLANAIKSGTTTITATSTKTPSISGTTTLTVTTSALTSITVTDTTGGSIGNIGLNDQLHATAHFADGSTQDVTSTATWNSNNTNIVTVSASGLATGQAAGTTTVTASVGSITSNPFTISVF